MRHKIGGSTNAGADSQYGKSYLGKAVGFIFHGFHSDAEFTIRFVSVSVPPLSVVFTV